MTRGDYFLMCVNTFVITMGAGHSLQALGILEEAGNLPEEALGGENPARAAVQFATWKIHPGHRKPEWLKAYEEGLANRVRISANENFEVSDALWRAISEALEHGGGPSLPRECVPLVAAQVQAVVVSKAVAAQFRAWVEWLPGGAPDMYLMGAP